MLAGVNMGEGWQSEVGESSACILASGQPKVSSAGVLVLRRVSPRSTSRPGLTAADPASTKARMGDLVFAKRAIGRAPFFEV